MVTAIFMFPRLSASGKQIGELLIPGSTYHCFIGGTAAYTSSKADRHEGGSEAGLTTWLHSSTGIILVKEPAAVKKRRRYSYYIFGGDAELFSAVRESTGDRHQNNI